ncbi:MAG: hypothetical protein ABT940_00750 [Alphaproteobacteria bacterium]
MLSFLKSFVGVKGKQLGQDIVSAIVEIDPAAATAAQLDQMEKDLDNAGMVLQKIRQDYDREMAEWQAVRKRYDQMLAAAEHLQTQLADPSKSPEEKASLEVSLNKLLAQLEELAPEVEAEHKDVLDVQALLDETQAAYRAKATALTTAKQNLDRAKRDMQRAVLEEERSEEKARRAAEVAGLRDGGTGNRLNVAVDAMQRRASEARAKSEAAKLKAETLGKLGAPGDGGDANIAAAMKAVEGSVAPTNTADRLAALRNKK